MHTTIKVSREIYNAINGLAEAGESKEGTVRRLMFGEPSACKRPNDSSVAIIKVSREVRKRIRRCAVVKETVDDTVRRLLGKHYPIRFRG